MSTARIETPPGPLFLAVENGALTALRFEDGPLHDGAPDFTARLRAYFDGDLRALDALPAAPAGTAFQQSVWRLVRQIPAGQTRSYGELARALGRPGASRAVGAANGANPVCLVIPCHRVIGASGALTGYAYGIDRKRWLLAHESSSVAHPGALAVGCARHERDQGH